MQKLYIEKHIETRRQWLEIELLTLRGIDYDYTKFNECDTFQDVVDTLKKYHNNNFFNYHNLDIKINGRWINNIRNLKDLENSLYVNY